MSQITSDEQCQKELSLVDITGSPRGTYMYNLSMANSLQKSLDDLMVRPIDTVACMTFALDLASPSDTTPAPATAHRLQLMRIEIQNASDLRMSSKGELLANDHTSLSKRIKPSC